MTLALLLLAAAPSPDDAYRLLLVAREPLAADARLQVRELKQPYFPGLKFFRGTGWAAGGHRELESETLAVTGDAVAVVIAETENLDDDGYHQRLKALWLCPVDYERTIRTTQDIKRLTALVAERASKCTSLGALAEERFTRALAEKQGLPWLDGYAGFLGALLTGYASLQPLRKQGELKQASLQNLLAAKAVPDAAWVKGPVAFAPWVTLTEGARFAGLGMAVGGSPETLELLEVRFEPRYTRERTLDGGREPPSSENHLSLVRKTVAFTRRFIE